MRRRDDTPIDPEIAAQLDAIDATLAGEPVDPEYAELAELALLLADEKPAVAPAFGAELDARVARRFDRPAAGAAEDATAPGLARRMWSWWPSLAAMGAGLAVAAVVVGVAGSGGGSSASSSASAPSPSSSTSAGSSAVSSAAATVGGPAVKRAPVPAASGASGGPSYGAMSSPAPTLQPPDNGRKIIQSAQLALSTAPSRLQDVAQEVFDVVGRENGIVRRSAVTATGGPDGSAEFQLSVPSSALTTTMSALSRLPYAHVASRTDTTQDVNDSYVAVQHRLADARALRTALLKQLANAVTQQQIDSLNAQIHDAEASIASDLATLRGLDRRINFSQISVAINAVPVPVKHRSGAFTIGTAAHDAGRVLTVGAGIALIALAVLTPLALVGGLLLWLGVLIRRRHREHALDLA